MDISLQQYRLAIGGFHCVHFKQEFKMARFMYFSLSWIIQIYLCNHYLKQLLMLGGDIEKNPGPVFPTTVLSYPTKRVITGNLHQGSFKYLLSATGTSTCMTNSLVALAYSQILGMPDWNSAVIDSILDMGKALYDKVYPNRHSKDSCPYLQVTDLNVNFRLKCRYFTCNPCFSLFGYVDDTVSPDNIVHKLDHALQTAFEISPQAILIIDEYGMALFKMNGQFHVFDSHSRNDEGYAHSDGRAVLVTVDSIADLCKHLRHLVCTLTEKPLKTVQFEITPVLLYLQNTCYNFYDLPDECTCSINTSASQSHINSDDLKSNKRKSALEEREPTKFMKTCQPSTPKVETDTRITTSVTDDDNCYITSETATSKYTYNPTDLTWQNAKASLFHITPPKSAVHFQGQGFPLGDPLTKDLIGDGNCFFRAISYLVAGNEKYHGLIRLKIVEHLKGNKFKFEKILRTQGQTIEQYLLQSEIAKLGKYAREVEIVATSHFLNTNIYTYMIDKRWLKYSGQMVDPHIGVEKKSIYLQHCNANHYQVVTQIRGDKSNPLRNYFTSQKVLQDQHMLSQKTTSTQRQLSKREKQQLRKENARTRMSVIRQSRSELDRENTKEQDRIRKLKDRKFKNEGGKEKQLDRLRKYKERRNKTELAKETDKQQNKVRMRTERVNRSELDKEKDKQQNKVRMRTERINRTELAKETEKQQNKVRMRSARINRTELAKDIDKQQNKVRMRSARINRTELAKEKDKQQNKVRMRTERINRTELSKEKDKQQNKVRKRTERINRSELAKEKDNQKNKVRMRTERINRTELAKENDNQKNKVRMRSARINRTELSKEKDKQQNKIRMTTERSNRTENQKHLEQKCDKARKNLRRFMCNNERQKSLLDFQSNASTCHPAFEIILDDFFQAIRSGPTYSCNCCNRFMYKSAVICYKAENYSQTDIDLLRQCVRDNKSEGSLWLCKTCHRSLQSNRMPAQAVANNLEVEPIPKQLSSLCQLESQLITRIIPFMKIVALPSGGQHGLRGQVVLVPSNIQKTATTLPRQTSESQIVALSLKRRLSDKYSVKKQYIRPHNVNEALEYLKKNNPFYKNVTTNSQWTDNSQLENPELWKATTEADLTSMTCKPNNTNDKIKANARSINIQPKQLSKPQGHDADIIVDSEEEVDDDNPDHVKMELSLKKTINSSTCLYPKEGPNVKTNQILHLAPGEGQRPTHVFYEKDWEAMTFPTLFPSGTIH
ncbi:uncharacterized protein [Ptychodera flava]|uniref:uncharacterized protein n=1 Tax=Ptychodera flava TaxID=63121 RepID=UPI00396A4413